MRGVLAVPAVQKGNTWVMSALPSCYVQCECFPSKLYLIGRRLYEIYIGWTVEKINPRLEKNR